MLWASISSAPVPPVGPGDDHRINWARAAVGASIVAAPRVHPSGVAAQPTELANLITPVHGREGVIFADEVQRERVVVDLGQERLVGRVFIGSGLGDAPRHPGAVTIRGSRRSARGPWVVLVRRGDMRQQHTFVFRNTRVRFLELDFGANGDGVGSRLTHLGVFTRYRCPPATQVIQWLAPLYDRDRQGLGPFFRAVDAERWDKAADELRAFYAARLTERPTEVSDHSRRIADELLAHRFEFGSITHTFGPRVDDIDWAFELDYEWTNTLNRCGFWTHTAATYLATGDARYAHEIEAQVLHWIESCPLPPLPEEGRYRTWMGWDVPARITWRSLDSAIRLWKLCYLVPVVAASREHFSDRLFANLLYSIWEHLDYLSDDDWDGGNWQSTVNSSVLDAAVAFPEFRDSAAWLAFAKSAFERNVLRDVREDGKEIENAVGYVQFAYSSMFHVLQALTERGVEVDPEVRRRLDLLQDFLAWCLFPDGTTPMIGDSDRGGTYPLESSWPFFGREDIRYIITQGEEGVRPQVASRYWSSSGWAVMRSAWDEGPFGDALHLVFKASPRGPHSHLDQLSFCLYAYGRPLLIDPGRCNYRAEGVRFRSTAYHNTVTVDGGNQADGDARFESWRSTDAYDLAAGSHPLYEGVQHRRTILFVKPRFWLVRDDLVAERPHRYEQHWHFPEDARPTELDGHWLTTRFVEGADVLVVPVTAVQESRAEDFEIAYQWDQPISAQGWCYTLPPGPTVVLLIPYRGAEVPRVEVGRLSVTEDETALEVSIGQQGWRLHVADGAATVERLR